MSTEFCHPCREDRGRLRAGVHRLDGRPVCEECFHGGNEEAIARCRKSRVNVIVPGSEQAKEETMECKTPGCGKRLNANNKLGFCTPCQKAGKHRMNGNRRAGGGIAATCASCRPKRRHDYRAHQVRTLPREWLGRADDSVHAGDFLRHLARTAGADAGRAAGKAR